jgi:Uma2 family endonuclease
MAKPARRATYDDLMQVPDHLVAELIDGELFTSPRPASPHARAASTIDKDLAPFDGAPGARGRPGGWWILFEPELHLGDDVLVPDLAAWRLERMPSIPNVTGFTLAPDWVCEVVSPRTGCLDRTKKLGVYGRAGVGHAWLVDPLARTLEVYRLEGGRWVVVGAHGGDETLPGVEPFTGVAIDLSRWWIETTAQAPG